MMITATATRAAANEGTRNGQAMLKNYFAILIPFAMRI
jgi:hypothetical protein